MMTASVLQCVSACKDRLCAQNKVVTQGITAPLEVFHEVTVAP